MLASLLVLGFLAVAAAENPDDGRHQGDWNQQWYRGGGGWGGDNEDWDDNSGGDFRFYGPPPGYYPSPTYNYAPPGYYAPPQYYDGSPSLGFQLNIPIQ